MAIHRIAKSTVYLPINSFEISSESFVACWVDIESYYTLVLAGSQREHPVEAHAADFLAFPGNSRDFFLFCSGPDDSGPKDP